MVFIGLWLHSVYLYHPKDSQSTWYYTESGPAYCYKCLLYQSCTQPPWRIKPHPSSASAKSANSEVLLQNSRYTWLYQLISYASVNCHSWGIKLSPAAAGEIPNYTWKATFPRNSSIAVLSTSLFYPKLLVFAARMEPGLYQFLHIFEAHFGRLVTIVSP